MIGIRHGRVPIAIIAAAALLTLSGCATATSQPATATPEAPAGGASRTVDAGAAPHTSATANPTPDAAAVELARFDAVNRATIAVHPGATGDDLITGLTSAGYPIEALEMTPDGTSIGLAAPSLQFAARTDTGCVIGQFLPDGSYGSSSAPRLSTGTCLIGATRALR